jgi:predicted nucleic acid-binding protein
LESEISSLRGEMNARFDSIEKRLPLIERRALALNSPVWSNEKEFKSQSKIKLYITDVAIQNRFD